MPSIRLDCVRWTPPPEEKPQYSRITPRTITLKSGLCVAWGGRVQMNTHNIEQVVVAYLIERKNGGTTSVLKSVLTVHLTDIGMKDAAEAVENLLKRKVILALQNGRVTLNILRLKKR